MTCASEEFVDLEVAVIFLTVLLHRWQALHLTLLGPTESAAGAVLLMDCQPGDSLITTLCFSLMERDKRLIGTDVISEIAWCPEITSFPPWAFSVVLDCVISLVSLTLGSFSSFESLQTMAIFTNTTRPPLYIRRSSLLGCKRSELQQEVIKAIFKSCAFPPL